MGNALYVTRHEKHLDAAAASTSTIARCFPPRHCSVETLHTSQYQRQTRADMYAMVTRPQSITNKLSKSIARTLPYDLLSPLMAQLRRR